MAFLLVNKEKIKVILKKGLEFRLGKTVFEVSVVEVSVAETPKELWFSFLQKHINKVVNEGEEVRFTPFSYAAQLNFIEGPQKGESVLVTYGPRAFGKDSVDSLILDEQAKEDCFCLVAYDHEKHAHSIEE